MRYDKNVSGTGVRLEFPHAVKFHTDSCLRCRGMILSLANSMYIMPVVHFAADAALNVNRIQSSGIVGSRQGAKCTRMCQLEANS